MVIISVDSISENSSQNDTLDVLDLMYELGDSIFDEDTAAEETTVVVVMTEDTSDDLDTMKIHVPKISGSGVNSPKPPRQVLSELFRNIKSVFVFLSRFTKQVLILLASFGTIFLTIFFYRKKIDGRRFMTSTRLSVMDREVQRACKYIENNYADQELSTEKLCEALVTGPAFLEALFERELGMGVMEFITPVRIHKVNKMLQKNPHAMIDDIVETTGFIDTDNLLKSFIEITDISFDEYLKTIQSGTDV